MVSTRVAPFGWVRFRRARRERRALLAPFTVEIPDEPADSVDDRDIASIVAAITAGASEIDVPADATVEGRPAPRDVVDALLADGARRSGRTLTWIESPDPSVRRAFLGPA